MCFLWLHADGCHTATSSGMVPHGNKCETKGNVTYMWRSWTAEEDQEAAGTLLIELEERLLLSAPEVKWIMLDVAPTVQSTLLNCSEGGGGKGFRLGAWPTSLEDCQCSFGRALAYGKHCTPCSIGKYKELIGDSACKTCNMSANGMALTTLQLGTIPAHSCLCPKGYYSNDPDFPPVCLRCHRGYPCHPGVQLLQFTTSAAHLEERTGNAPACLAKVSRTGGSTGSASATVVLERAGGECQSSAMETEWAQNTTEMEDFEFQPGPSLTWGDGDSSEQCVFGSSSAPGSTRTGAGLIVFGDAAVEGNEVICLKLIGTGEYASVNPYANIMQITIQDRGADGGPSLTCVKGWPC